MICTGVDFLSATIFELYLHASGYYEALRLYPPGWLMTRKALKDDYLGDYFVPAGTEIYISPYLSSGIQLLGESGSLSIQIVSGPINRRKQALAMLPFSSGPRKCIGELLAQIEMQIH